MGTWEVDTLGWPVVIYRMGEGATEADVEAFIRAGDAVLARDEPFAAVLDASGLRGVSPQLRRRTEAWQRSNRARLERHCVGTAFVLPSPLLRFISMTILMLTDYPTAWRVFASADEAIEWALRQARPHIRRAQGEGGCHT